DSKLLNAVREARTRRTARPSLIGVLGRRPLGQERQDFVLLGAREPREGFGVFREAEALEPSQCLKILLLGSSALSREAKINEAVDLGSLRAGRAGRRNDEVGEHHHRLILVLVKKFGLPVRGSERGVGR